jgi:N-acetylglutamate synthase-like GNAT family acetyltransferase
MHFIPLNERPCAIAQIARWHYQEWHALFPQRSEDDFAAELAQCLGAEPIPQTWLLVDEDDAVIGTCSLLHHDMTTNRDLTPWLANVYVRPDRRGQGLGRMLVQQVMQAARSMGIAHLYLFTEDQQRFYQQLGWFVLRTQHYETHPVSVMCCEL